MKGNKNMKKSFVILTTFIVLLSSCNKGSNDSPESSYHNNNTYTSTKKSYTVNQLVNYLVNNGEEQSSSSYYTIDIQSGSTFYTLGAIPASLSFRIEAAIVASDNSVSGGLIMYHDFTWNSMDGGNYESGFVASNGTTSKVVQFDINPTSYYSDYEIEKCTYTYRSSLGLNQSDYKELVLKILDAYNTAIDTWNTKLINLGYPTLR